MAFLKVFPDVGEKLSGLESFWSEIVRKKLTRSQHSLTRLPSPAVQLHLKSNAPALSQVYCQPSTCPSLRQVLSWETLSDNLMDSGYQPRVWEFDLQLDGDSEMAFYRGVTDGR